MLQLAGVRPVTSPHAREISRESRPRSAPDEEREFTALVERYYPRALRFALNMGLTREDAEEVVQDAFVRVHRALPRFTPGAPVEPWLFRILANRCRSAHGRARWWRTRTRAGDAELARVPARENEDAVLRWLDAERLHRAARRALDALPAAQREAFLLRYVDEMEYDEIMRITGSRLSALKMRVKRARDTLRLLLKEEDG